MFVDGAFDVWIQNRPQDANPVVFERYRMVLRIEFHRIQSHRPPRRLPRTGLDFDDDFFKRLIRDVFLRGCCGFEESDISCRLFQVSNLASGVRHLLVQIRQIYGNRCRPGMTFGLLVRCLCDSYDPYPGIIDFYLFSGLKHVVETENDEDGMEGTLYKTLNELRVPHPS